VDHHAAVRERVALALRASGEQHGAHRRRLAEAVRRDLRLDELHRVVDREAGGHRAARRIDVHLDVLRPPGLVQEEELRHHRVRDLVVDRGADEDDAVLEEARVDVVGPLAAARTLDDEGDEGLRFHRGFHAGHSIGPRAGGVGVAVRIESAHLGSVICAFSRRNLRTLRSRISIAI
jgi:hypothetical protein